MAGSITKDLTERLTDVADLTAVANAIRAKGKILGPLVYPDGFVEAINGISQGQGSAFNLSKTQLKQLTDDPLSPNRKEHDVCTIPYDGSSFIFFSWDITDKNDIKLGELLPPVVTIIAIYIPSLNINYGVATYTPITDEGPMTISTDMVTYDKERTKLIFTSDYIVDITNEWTSKSNTGTVLYFG